MSFTQSGLPFAAGSHESYQAAVRAEATRQNKTQRYLRFLAKRGPATDHDARAALNLPLSSICSIRNGAMHCGLVERGNYAKAGPYARACRVWQLSERGYAVVAGEQAR